MQVKIYEAKDMRSAIEKVKKDLGPEALILSSRNVYTKSGKLGKPRIEVTAAVDNSSETFEEKSNGKNGRYVNLRSGSEAGAAPAAYSAFNGKAQFEQILEKQSQASPNGQQRKKHLDCPDMQKDNALFDEMKQVKLSFQGLAKEIAEIKGKWSSLSTNQPGLNGRHFAADNHEDEVSSELEGLGFEAEVLRMLSEKVKQIYGFYGKESRENLDRVLERTIAEMVEIQNPISRPWSGQKRISFIGPTGVGKTTTIAKVAANYLLNFGKSIALATIDNFRIAAVEQLKIYGRIMNIPVETARSPQQLKHIFHRNRDKDLILVDTAGRSPRDELSLRELSAFLDPQLQIENQLVLSVTTRENDLYNVIRRFQNLDLHGLVFTKLDECDRLGSILNVQLRARRPISFLTNGQKVPEDLLPHESLQLAKMMLQSKEVVEKWNFREDATRPKLYAH